MNKFGSGFNGELPHHEDDDGGEDGARGARPSLVLIKRAKPYPKHTPKGRDLSKKGASLKIGAKRGLGQLGELGKIR